VAEQRDDCRLARRGGLGMIWAIIVVAVLVAYAVAVCVVDIFGGPKQPPTGPEAL